MSSLTRGAGADDAGRDAPVSHSAPAPASRLRAVAAPAALVAVAFVGRYAVPWPDVRAVLVAPALLWVPGYGVISALGLRSALGRWAVPFAALLSLVVMVCAALISYAGFRYVPLGTLPLWVSLGSLPLSAWRPRHARPPRESLRVAGFGAAFGAGAVVVAALVAGLVHVLPSQQQPGFLAFSFGGDFADVPGVVQARAGGILEVPVSVSGSGQDLSGLTVAVARDGYPLATTPTVPVQVSGSGHGYARIELPVPAACLSRYSFTLRRADASLRLLDLYVTTGKLAACHG
jgi:hypothetical protein